MLSSNTSAVSGDTAYIEDVFSTYLYTGNGTSQTITNNIDLSTKGGLVWMKKRGVGTGGHQLYDTARGATKVLFTDATVNQLTYTNGLTAFGTTGFSIGSDSEINGSGDTQVSWTFRKQPKFFDVVTYTGNGSTQTISHSLGSVPGCIIVKKTSAADGWQVYHQSLGNAKVIRLQSTNAASSVTANYWQTTTPTSTEFYIGSDSSLNESGQTYVAHIFAHDAGGFGLTGTDNVISCGTFNGADANVSVTLGYEPQWLLVKRTDGVGTWRMFDTMRGMTADGKTAMLYANASDAEIATNTNVYTPTATGFIAGSNIVTGTYIYIAIRRGPMKVPTDATKVFKPVTRAGTSATATVTGVGFSPDSALIKNRGGSADSVDWSFNFFDRLRHSGYRLSTNSTNAEDTSINFITSFDQDGMTLPSTGYTATNGTDYNYINYFFKRAPSFFDEVCYTGTGAAMTVSHNLGVVPELMIVKSRSTTVNWPVYVSAVGNTNNLFLNTTAAADVPRIYWNNTTPTASVFSLGDSSVVSNSGVTYVAYLFATCAGVSKVGSYTGNGALTTINCGFTGGARFVMIKRTDSAASWYVWDTARGMVSGTDPSLQINYYSAEVTGNSIYTATTGFQIVASPAVDVNTSGGTYIYLAIA